MILKLFHQDIRATLSYYMRNHRKLCALYGNYIAITSGFKCVVTMKVGYNIYRPISYYINRAFFDISANFTMIHLSKIYENDTLVCDIDDAISYNDDGVVFRGYGISTKYATNIYSKKLCNIYSILVVISGFTIIYRLLNRITQKSYVIRQIYDNTGDIYALFIAAMTRYKTRYEHKFKK